MALAPTSDVSASGWIPSTGGSVFETINEGSYSDADYAYSPLADAQPLVEGFSTFGAGETTIRIRKWVSAGTASVRVLALNDADEQQGVSDWQTITETPTTLTFTITTTGTSTRLRFEVGYEIPPGALMAFSGSPIGLDGDYIALA